MRLHEIDDPDDPRLADYRDLTDVALRRVLEPDEGLYIAESAKVIARALAAGHRPRSVLVQSKWIDDVAPLLTRTPDVEVFVVPAGVAERLTGYAVHRGALAAMHRPALRSVAETVSGARTVVVMEDIVDHTNVGAIMRNCAALGADAVLVTRGCADPLYRRAVRVSMGTVFQVPWTRIENWPASQQAVRRMGFKTVAFGLRDDAQALDEFAASPPERIALIFGTEGAGLRPSTLDSADAVVRIPMREGVDSLNVAAATGIGLWAIRQAVGQR